MLTPSDLVAAGHALDVRDGDRQRDAIDGVVPGIVLEPHTPAAVAAALAWASERRLSVLIEGAATKRAWGRPPDRLDVLLSLRRLNRILAHRHGDLTVSVEAGLSLRELNEALAVHGQQLPLDPPFASGATVGGLLATNDSGPARHRYGTPRDLVIGVQLAIADGTIANAGGQVVKNVAGYDLSKLVCGSFGTLAVILSATFKLSPLPAASSTLVIGVDNVDSLARFATAIAASQLEPLAFEIQARRTTSGVGNATRCLLRFASVAAAVSTQAEEAVRQLASCGLSGEVVTGESEDRLWRHYSAGETQHTPAEAWVRVSWLPADLGRVLALLDQLGSATDVDLSGRVGVGAGVVRLGGDAQGQAAAVRQLGRSTVVGNVVVVRASTELKALVDIWGPRRNGELLDAIKHAIDPRHTLGAGRA